MNESLVREKHCTTCGRVFGWRKRWESKWDRIEHCGPKCARRRLTAADRRLEQSILDLLRQAGDVPISPNDAARRCGRGWRALTERARDAARRLCARGEVDFVQGHRVVDASSAKGPVKLRLREST